MALNCGWDGPQAGARVLQQAYFRTAHLYPKRERQQLYMNAEEIQPSTATFIEQYRAAVQAFLKAQKSHYEACEMRTQTERLMNSAQTAMQQAERLLLRDISKDSEELREKVIHLWQRLGG